MIRVESATAETYFAVHIRNSNHDIFGKRSSVRAAKRLFENSLWRLEECARECTLRAGLYKHALSQLTIPILTIC